MANKTPFTRAQARACPVHSAVLEQCKIEMQQHNYCNKLHALTITNFIGVADAIYWNYIREFIEEDLKVTLLSLSEIFFEGEMIKLKGAKRKKHVTYGPGDKHYVEKSLAQGYGKTCKGFGNIEIGGGRLAIKTLGLKAAVANGVKDAHIDLATAVQNNSQITSTTLKALPAK